VRSRTSPERLKFIEAFESCVRDGVYPGPLELNKRRGQLQPVSKLNGRLSSLRLTLMKKHGVAYKRNGAYGDAGQVPNIR
jgi:hypothetical protein